MRFLPWLPAVAVLLIVLVSLPAEARSAPLRVMVSSSNLSHFRRVDGSGRYVCYHPLGTDQRLLGTVRPNALIPGVAWSRTEVRKLEQRLQASIRMGRPRVSALRELRRSKSRCRTMLFDAGEPTPTPTPSLENALIQVELDERGGLERLFYRPSRYTFQFEQSAPWFVRLTAPTIAQREGLEPDLLVAFVEPMPERCTRASALQRTSAGGVRRDLTWSCQIAVELQRVDGLPLMDAAATGSLMVEVHYQVDPGNAFVETWASASISSSTLAISRFFLPYGQKRDAQRLEYGITSSYLFEATRDPSRHVLNRPRESSYSLQNVIGGVWGDAGPFTLFLTDDDGFELKEVAYGAASDVFTISNVLVAESVYEPSNRVESPSHLRIIAGEDPRFRGEEGWYPLARLYRQHLEQRGVLGVPVADRSDIPNFLKNLDLTLFSAPQSYGAPAAALSSVASAFADAVQHYGATNSNIFFWEGGAVGHPLSYQGSAAQQAFYTDLRSRGLHPCIRTLFSAMPTVDAAYPAIAADANLFSPLSPVPAPVPGFSDVVGFDPFSEGFLSWFTSRLRGMSGGGRALGCIFSDGTHTFYSTGNGLWNPHLAAQRRRGTTSDVLRGAFRLYERIGREMSREDPDFFLFHESAIGTSNFAGGLDAQSAIGLRFGSNAHPGELASIVQGFYFLEAVFSRYNVRMGAGVEAMNLLLPFSSPFEFDPAQPFSILDQYDLAVGAAALQAGGVPIDAEYDVGIGATPEAPRTLPNYRANDPQWGAGNGLLTALRPLYQPLLLEHTEFLRSLIGVRQRGRKFFVGGEWLPPPALPDVAVDQQVFYNVDAAPRTRSASLPIARVLAAAWRAADGDIGVFLFNHYRNAQAQTVRLELTPARFGLAADQRYDVYTVDAQGERQVFSGQGDSGFPLTIPRKGIVSLTLRMR